MIEPLSTPASSREYSFTEKDFLDIRDRVKRLTGINLGESKRELVYGRISRRLRALGLRSFGEYRRLLQEDNAPELVEFCNALTTNLTSFFRESHHFEHLVQKVFPDRIASAHLGRRIRIWSTSCSSGEEPYSIAMAVCEAFADLGKWDIRILATDIDSEMLAVAQRGVYTADRVSRMSASRLRRFFREVAGSGETPSYEILPEVKNLVTFKKINLTKDLPMPGPLDAIFCRNVVIYFDKDTQRDLFTRIARLQREGDLLFLGHSESLIGVSNDYALVGRTIYQRINP